MTFYTTPSIRPFLTASDVASLVKIPLRRVHKRATAARKVGARVLRLKRFLFQMIGSPDPRHQRGGRKAAA